jgi:hypothetical protein
MSTKGSWKRPASKDLTAQELAVRQRLIYGTQAEKLYSCDWFIKHGTVSEKAYCLSLRDRLVGK